MYNNEKQTVSVITFASGVDAYGQPRKGTQTSRNIEMLLRVYSQNTVSDVRYIDVTMVGLTNDKTLTNSNQIIANGITYNILYIIPSKRLYTVLMKEAG